MPDPIDAYWQLKLECCKRALEKNRFEVFVAPDPASAGALFFDRIFPDLKVQTASWRDSIQTPCRCFSVKPFQRMSQQKAALVLCHY